MTTQLSLTTRWLQPGDALSDAYAVRTKVFIEEQNVPVELEVDELDPLADHLVIYNHHKPVATGRIVWSPTVTIGRIAVLPELRGSGIGAEIVRGLTSKVFERDINEVHLHAQAHAVAFYEKLGFISYGEPYVEAGIPHLSMKKVKP